MPHRGTILVVEDSSTAAKRLQQSLERAGYDVCLARNGQEACQRATNTVFDVVVTDEQMPVMSGQEMVRQLRSDGRYSRTPVIFLTASESTLDASRLKDELNVAAVMRKPFAPELITNFIQRLMRSSPR